MTWVATLMAWDDGQTLGRRFEHASLAAKRAHRHWSMGRSYSGFAGALVRETPRTLERLIPWLRRRMLEIGAPLRRGWNLFTCDGSRIEAPRTEANEAGLGRAGRAKSPPQVYLTAMWHVGTGLPWDFRSGPGTASEKAHLAEMVDDLPTDALLVADASFASYGLCRDVIAGGRSFLLRVGANKTLLTDLGWDEREEIDGVVSLWPQERQRDDEPPLTLRLIELRRKGHAPVFLLTNVLDASRLTDEDAGALYALRWEGEVFFRSRKQTLERRTLLSRRPETALAEVAWTFVGLWLLGLLSVSRLVAEGHDPLRWSPAGSRDAVRRAIRNVPRGRRRSLDRLLSTALRDTYVRKRPKKARHTYPRKKTEKPPGAPKVRPAGERELQRARDLRSRMAAVP